MEEIRIRSKSDLKREKQRLLRDIKESGVSIKRNARDNFMPTRLSSTGKTRVDINKLLTYAVLAYKGIIFANKMKQFLSKGKRRRKKS